MRNSIIIALIIFFVISLCPTTIIASINLTEQEQEFMQQHPIIRLGVDPAFVPFEYFDNNGEYTGITADYLTLITEYTGLQFEVLRGFTWSEAYELALVREVDVLPAVSKTAEREQKFIFSDHYYDINRVIVTREEDKRISGLEELAGKTIAVQSNSAYHSYLLTKPEINLSLYDSVGLALAAVAEGLELAFVGNLATTSYVIQTQEINSLRLIVFEYDQQQRLYFAVRDDWPELVSIINKVLLAITDAEKTAIKNKWVDLDVTIDNSYMVRYIIIAGLVVLLNLLISYYWTFKLRQEINKRKIIQEQLEIAKKESDRANKFKSSFLARMSHEIRTPLNAIGGMAYLLKQTELNLNQKMHLARIKHASNIMLSIINDILDFSKIEAGKIELEHSSFSLDEVIQDVIAIVSYKIEEQQIGFKLFKEAQVPTWFFGDSQKLGQILLNVINNAAKFTKEGEVSFDIRLIAFEADKCLLAFTVKDTGIGMEEAQIKQLFEPFTQAKTSISSKAGGTGLGLSIVKSFVELMNGQIQVHSTENEGSTFIIKIALEIDEAKELEYKEEIASGYFAGIKTLVLEKTGSSRNLIDSYLSAFGMKCELTSSEADALAMLEKASKEAADSYDLLILDYETPQEQGFVFVKNLRNNPEIINMPKVMLLIPLNSEDLLEELENQQIEAGIMKPVMPSILFNSILETFKLQAIVANQEFEKKNQYEEDADNNPYTILIVEDNKTNQLIAKSILQQVGFDVLMANNGKEGVNAFIKHSAEIDLILMDLQMVVLNGYDAAAQIRTMSKQIPIVAITADVIQDVKQKCDEAGIDHYISKPFNPKKLITKVMEIIKASKQKVDTTEKLCSVVTDEEKAAQVNLDEQRGIKNLGGNKELYEMVLQEYNNENKNTGARLESALADKQYDNALQIVHKVKSSTASIGATELYKTVIKLQRELKKQNLDDTAVGMAAQDFIREITALLKYIELKI